MNCDHPMRGRDPSRPTRHNSVPTQIVMATNSQLYQYAKLVGASMRLERFGATGTALVLKQIPLMEGRTGHLQGTIVIAFGRNQNYFKQV